MSDVEVVAEAMWLTHTGDFPAWAELPEDDRNLYQALAQAAIDALGLTPEWAAGGPGVWLSREGAAQHAKYYDRKLRRRLVTSWVEEMP